MNGLHEIRLNVFNKTVLINSYDEICTDLITRIYKNLIENGRNKADLTYQVHHDYACKKFSISKDGVGYQVADTPSDFIYYLEKSFTIEVQKLQPDFFYLHAAAVSNWDKIILISGDSGAGKSTITWALLNHDYKYLSDELAPVNLDNHSVLPFPHALCLKNSPPDAYPLPGDTVILDRTKHIPIAPYLKIDNIKNTLCHIFFIQYDQNTDRTQLNELSEAETTLQLYKNGLNQLAHLNDGLHPANLIAKRTPGHSLIFSDIKSAISTISGIIN